jgi:hypothetical protein
VTIESPILAPAIVLVLWSLFMLAWLAISRLPAMSRAGIQLGSVVGGRGATLEGVIPDRVNWKSHNYTHLMEQPTLFYVTVVVLALLGEGSGFNLQLAWVYVALRVVHSLVQSLWNRVIVRFTIFSASTLALLGLAINAARAALKVHRGHAPDAIAPARCRRSGSGCSRAAWLAPCAALFRAFAGSYGRFPRRPPGAATPASRLAGGRRHRSSRL